MFSKISHQVLSLSLCAMLLVEGVPAQTSPQPSTNPAPTVAPLTSGQLDSLVAPIALYPDALVAQVLAASCYPEEVAFADDWLGQNSNLQGSALTQAIDQQPWDPSVKALTQFRSVLHDLAKNLSWTSSLGQAFSNQQADVMAAVQVMRAKAQAAGTLQSSTQIKVVHQSPQTIVIEPADSNVVYVPQYNPTVVFGAPLLVPAYTPPVAVAAGVSFGAGVAIGAALGGGGFVAGGFGGGGWGFGAWGMNWGGGGGGNISYNNNSYVNKTVINKNSNNNNGNRFNNNGNNNGNRNSGNSAGNHNNGNQPAPPSGINNQNHGMIGGANGVQHQVADGNRPDRFGANQPHSAWNGNGNQARTESDRGRGSMQPAGFQRQQRSGQQQRQQPHQQPRQQQQPRGGGERGGERR